MCEIYFGEKLKKLISTFTLALSLSLYFSQVPLFQGTELGFTKMLSLYIQPLLVPKGEYIVRKGDIGEEVAGLSFYVIYLFSFLIFYVFQVNMFFLLIESTKSSSKFRN